MRNEDTPIAGAGSTAAGAIDLRRLKDTFGEQDVEWRPLAYTKDRKRALVVAFVNNRAIMDRLDDVCRPENWRNAFRRGPNGGVICGISVRVHDEWITKWDGAANTDVEAVKGGLSSSMRRAAVQWGIGRYLYRLPRVWVPVDERGRITTVPSLPPDYRVSAPGDGIMSPRLEPYVVVGKNERRRRPRTAKTG